MEQSERGFGPRAIKEDVGKITFNENEISCIDEYSYLSEKIWDILKNIEE